MHLTTRVIHLAQSEEIDKYLALIKRSKILYLTADFPAKMVGGRVELELRTCETRIRL